MCLLERPAIPSVFLPSYSKQQSKQQPEPQAGGEVQLTEAVGALKAFSFVVEEKDHGLNMHRLVQLVGTSQGRCPSGGAKRTGTPDSTLFFHALFTF